MSSKLHALAISTEDSITITIEARFQYLLLYIREAQTAIVRQQVKKQEYIQAIHEVQMKQLMVDKFENRIKYEIQYHQKQQQLNHCQQTMVKIKTEYNQMLETLLNEFIYFRHRICIDYMTIVASYIEYEVRIFLLYSV